MMILILAIAVNRHNIYSQISDHKYVIISNIILNGNFDERVECITECFEKGFKTACTEKYFKSEFLGMRSKFNKSCLMKQY